MNFIAHYGKFVISYRHYENDCHLELHDQNNNLVLSYNDYDLVFCDLNLLLGVK